MAKYREKGLTPDHDSGTVTRKDQTPSKGGLKPAKRSPLAASIKRPRKRLQ